MRITVSNHRGFTLVELIVAVAIIAILVRIAYPVYQDHLMRSRRAEGKAALLKAAQLQERNYLSGDPTAASPTPTYLTSGKLAILFGLADGAAIYSGENPSLATGWYTITAGTCATGTIADCVLLTATPRFTDAQCGTLTLDSAGNRNESGTMTVADCWDR